MLDNAFDRFLGSLYHVEDSIGKPAFFHKLCRASHCERYLLAGLEEHGVFHDEGDGDGPHGNLEQGKMEMRNGTHAHERMLEQFHN